MYDSYNDSESQLSMETDDLRFVNEANVSI